jgi:hypothetical protein
MVERLEHTLADIDALKNLVRSAVGGTANIDWDAEFEKLAGGAR